MGDIPLEVLTALSDAQQTDAGRTAGVPLLFVHGVCHGAWCWENFLPCAAAAGHDAYAVSLRGHGGSGGQSELHSYGLGDYVDDVLSVAADISGRTGHRPVVVGHSMGGAVVQQLLGDREDAVAGAVLLAPATVGGLAELARPTDSGGGVSPAAEAMKALMGGGSLTPQEASGLAFFDDRLDADTLVGAASRLQSESLTAIGDLMRPYTVNYDITVPVSVIGSAADLLFGEESLQATAAAYGVEPVILPDQCHDMMLDRSWRETADAVLAAVTAM